MAQLENSQIAGEGFSRTALHQRAAYLVIDKNYPPELRAKFDGKGPQKLEFTYLPNELSLSGEEPTWNEVEIIGRWSPYHIYASTTAAELGFTLQFFAEEDAVKDVKQKVDWLRAMKYPVVHEGITYRPPSLLFVWGRLFTRRCLLKEATPVYRGPWFNEAEDGRVTDFKLLPMQAEVSVTLTFIEDLPVSGEEVMAGRL